MEVNMILKKFDFISLILSLLFIVFVTGHLYAEIVFDGTINPQMSGLMYEGHMEISADMGKQMGQNLFHSFQTFNINQDEIANFSGPDSINNIITRVTGGESSWINGTLNVSIPEANFYLLNPSGFMFGPKASLNLSGSFHVSSADYLSFEDGKFFSEPLEMDVLSTSAPQSFGFLDNDIGKISIEGKDIYTQNESNETQAGIHLSEGQTFSIIGGDIHIQRDAFYQDTNDSIVNVPSGNINLVSVESSGEITLTESGIHKEDDLTSGDITLYNNASIDVSGECAGNIFILADKFEMTNSSISANTFGDNDGGNISIQAKQIYLNKDSSITSHAEGQVKGSDIDLNADHIHFESPNNISSNLPIHLNNTNTSGDIQINSNAIVLIEKGTIESGSIESKAGNITIEGGTIEMVKNHSESGLIIINPVEFIHFDERIISPTSISNLQGNLFFLNVQRSYNFRAASVQYHSFFPTYSSDYENLNANDRLSFIDIEQNQLISYTEFDTFGFNHRNFVK
jgi:filamentous hemagglutinin family protein